MDTNKTLAALERAKIAAKHVQGFLRVISTDCTTHGAVIAQIARSMQIDAETLTNQIDELIAAIELDRFGSES